MMDHTHEHTATLCALGTLGLAAAGLALGAGEETLLTRPGKRKSPGSDTAYTYSPPMPPPSRRVVSNPVESIQPRSPAVPRSLSTSLFRRKYPADSDQGSTDGIQETQSRSSSANRRSVLSRSSPQAPAVEEDESRPRSSWMRRLSTMSSLHTQSPAPSTYKFDMTPTSTPVQPAAPPSNRLVKRATSQRLMSSNSSKKLFRRPATSHQRSASLMTVPTATPPPSNLREAYRQDEDRPMSSASVWRPFFSSGYARKRPTTPGTRESTARTISISYAQQPTLVNARAVRRQSLDQDNTYRDFQSSPAIGSTAPRGQRLRRSLSSFRKHGQQRYFTEPVVGISSQNAHGSILPVKQSPLSPVSRTSTFDIDLPPGTPIFTSSPPVAHAPRTNPSINKRISVAPSDPNTVSSDNDTRLFSDDESMDFHSDTAYDSLATRATVSSQSGHRQPKIDTIFDESNSEHTGAPVHTLEALMQRSTINDNHLQSTRGTSAWSENVGIGIRGFDDDFDDRMDSEGPQTLTPVREHPYGSVEELNATPVAFRRGVATLIGSSPRSSVVRRPPQSKGLAFSVSQDIEMDEDGSIDWSPKSDKESKRNAAMGADSPIVRRTARLLNADYDSETKRASIFDWSENQKPLADVSSGISPRPKTVHGKQGDEQGRSRTAGRKGPSAVHLRSQSVPVNRDSGADMEIPASNAKFGTWGLGNKPVSEEWSEDFEFDDTEEDTPPLELAGGSQELGPRDSTRSVKVPQSIIDRQASVHQQFSQVQEFMMLVEELRRLRTQGAQLDLLESQSRQLWEDAENIINLATLNDEDEVPARPGSPISSDIFGDDTSPSSRRISAEDSKRDSFGIRSTSGPATPPSVTRPRGESLAQAKTFLQTIHQHRGNIDLTPPQVRAQREKLPFDTQDLRDLVVKAGVITRALKDIVRKAQGVQVSPERTPQKQHDPTFSHIFNPPDTSPCPPLRRAGIPKSHSANSYLSESVGTENEIPPPLKLTMIEV